MTQLRDYQIEASESVQKAFATGLRRVAISLPCRCGKTVIAGDMISQVFAKGRTAMMLVHRDILVEQTVRKLLAVLPANAVGVVKAERNEITKPVIVASVQTLSRDNRLAQLIPPALTVVDEGHLSMALSYQKIFEHIDAVAVRADGKPGRGFMVGLSATWARPDGKGLGGTWEKVVFKRSIRWAVDNGYMVEPRAIRLGGDLNLAGLKTDQNGDYRSTDLEEIVMIPDIRDTVVQGYQKFGEHRPAVLFAPTKAAARYFGAGFEAAGMRTGEYFDDTKKDARRFNMSGYVNGAIKVLLTCSALGIGWDEPRASVAILTKPYGHLTPFIQEVSRVLTPWPGKTHGLILDGIGATDNKSMKSVVDLSVHVPREVSDDRDDYEVIESDHEESKEEVIKRRKHTTEVDLFAGTEARWLTTKHGVPFVTTKEHIYFVVQVDGTWAVGRCSSKSIQGGCWLVKGLTSAEALEHGSEIALEEDASIAGRKSSWRRGNQDPTASQLQMAHGMGIDIEGMNKAAVSDAINVHKATQILANINGGS